MLVLTIGAILILLLWLYDYYKPTLDYILDNNYYTIYLWYYKYDKLKNHYKRTYKVLLKIKK